MKRKEAEDLLEAIETALAHGRVITDTIKPIPDPMEEPRTTYEEGKHDGYLEGLHDGIEGSMGMVEHFIDTLDRIPDINLED